MTEALRGIGLCSPQDGRMARLGKSGWVVLAWLFLSLPLALGQDERPDGAPGEPDAKRVWSDHVVVTAARTEEQEEDVPASVTVLSQTEIRQSPAQTVDDLLRQVPGFSLFRRASSLVAHPTSQGVSLRGIGPSGVSRTLVLLDGIPLNDPFGGWVYWSRVPIESLEKIEVVRGGGSNVWGNYALGGVINLITGKSNPGSFSLLGRGGNQETASLDVTGGLKAGAASVSLQGSFFETDGYETVRADQRGAIDVNANSEHQAFSGKIEFASSPSALTYVNATLFDEERGNGTPLTGNETQTGYLGAGSSFTTAHGGTWNVALFSHLQEFASFFSAQAADRSSERPALDQFDVDSRAVGASLQWSRGFDSAKAHHVLTSGSEFRWIDGETRENFRFFPDHFTRGRVAGGEQQVGGIYLQESYGPGSRFKLQVGGRFDVWKSRQGSRAEINLDNGAPTRTEIFPNREETAVSPKLAMLYAATDTLKLRGSLYRAFRAPTINELFRPFRVRNDITEANATLDPERLAGAEAGLDYRSRALGWRLTGFYNEVDDPISNVTLALGPGVIAPCGFVPGGGSCRQRQNLDRTRIQGAEAEIEGHPNRQWSLSASYLYSDAEVLEAANQPEVVGKRIAQVPRHQVVLKLAYHDAPRIDAFLQGRYVDDQFEDDLNTRPLADFVVVDLSLSRPIRERWDLLVGVENLLDETIEVGRTGAGLVSIGAPRLIHGGFRFRWGR